MSESREDTTLFPDSEKSSFFSLESATGVVIFQNMVMDGCQTISGSFTIGENVEIIDCTFNKATIISDSPVYLSTCKDGFLVKWFKIIERWWRWKVKYRLKTLWKNEKK